MTEKQDELLCSNRDGANSLLLKRRAHSRGLLIEKTFLRVDAHLGGVIFEGGVSFKEIQF